MSATQALRASIKYRGLAGTVRHLVSRPLRRDNGLSAAQEFDARYGVDTAGRIEVADAVGLGENLAHAVHYEPTHAPSFLTAIESLGLHWQDFTFIDFGSGKGLAMLLASWFPFRAIRGVEFSPELHEVCELNIRAFRSERQKCFDLASTAGDATEFAIPEGPGLYYFFNPFQGPVMQRVMQNIAASYANAPREMYVVYFNPLASESIPRAGFVLVGESAGHRLYRMGG